MRYEMLTRWGKNLNREASLPEYPRPQLRRESYCNLNGPWQYAVTDTPDKPHSYDGEIIVPFSPESLLSGIEKPLRCDQYLHYKRTFCLPANFRKNAVLLHFEAVDQICDVFVNDRRVCHHEGGYLPFSADITGALREGENELCVTVTDDPGSPCFGRGKQSGKSQGIWYTAQSGIWQTVWLESVPQDYIESIRLTPQFDSSSLSVVLSVKGEFAPFTVIVCDGEGEIVRKTSSEPETEIEIPVLKPWSPEEPFLYDLEIRMKEDIVYSYFAMRKFSYTENNGHKVFALNNKPYFHNGLLDQGYWPDGLMTAPSDEAMVYDIQTAKEMGFNMLRKHIKIEPLRWYYHCDRLGMLVWQDMVSGGDRYDAFLVSILPTLGKCDIPDTNQKRFARSSEKSRSTFLNECCDTVEHLYNCPSICLWVPFNEGWGQFDTLKVADKIRALDKTRFVDHASGWHDQNDPEIKSRHIYFRKLKMKNDGRALCLSEFGGYICAVPGHKWCDSPFGYKITKNGTDFEKAYSSLMKEELLPMIQEQGLTASVYTQLTDVEQEMNGLITYDREVCKIPKEKLAALNTLIKF